MTTWTTFTETEPDLAERARAILSSTTNCVLATIRADGSPRISGIDPFWPDGQLCIGMMANSRKGADLARDPRMALHAIPWESRKIREGATDPGAGDAKVTGKAVLLGHNGRDAELIQEHFADLGVDPPEGGGDFYKIDVDMVVVVFVSDDELVIDRWSSDAGRAVVRRT